jgi:hypothetical protein
METDMTKESDGNSSLPQALLLQGMRIWQMPLLMGAAWWDALGAGWPHDPMPHHHDDHDQLVVPEPIEVEGERGLFA